MRDQSWGDGDLEVIGMGWGGVVETRKRNKLTEGGNEMRPQQRLVLVNTPH